jgi:predicted DNA-binding ribbon-helix-helix protein
MTRITQRNGKLYQASLVQKRSVSVAGHLTSISLEPQFWDALKEIASLTEYTIHELITLVDRKRTHENLSSALRCYALAYYQKGLELD